MNTVRLSSGDTYADDLTWREQEVLMLLAEHLTNQEIASQLHLAESTIKDYVGKILSKLYVKNRREAVARAKELELLNRVPIPMSVPRSNLPPERTPFVGRKSVITAIKHQLKNTRLLSLIGPGGIGKSRLALKVAEQLRNDFKDGVFFVPLAPIQSVKDIIQAIAEGLRFPIATHESAQHPLLRYLRDKQLLLVIDNFEHLLDGVNIVNEILQTAPNVRILTTSRERLNLQSEMIYHVSGMVLPDDFRSIDALNYDAITLFLQSAGKVRPDYSPSHDDLEQIANICQFVEGMPLAIELAAAWLHVINLNEIADELEKDIDILVSEMRDAPARHRSIRAVFDQSWSMLDQTEQEIFIRLSVFRGGFTREAAQQVAGASLQLLAAFVNKSFLSHDQASGRFEIHELLRQYVKNRLEKPQTDKASIQETHAAYYAEFMQQRWAQLKCDKQMLALSEIKADIENVRTAWRYYLDQKNISQIWKFVYAIWYVHWIWWWNQAGMELFAEAAKAFQEADDEESVIIMALAMAFQGYFMAWLGLSKQGYEITEKSATILEKSNHPRALIFAYQSLSVNAYFLSRFTTEIAAVHKQIKIINGIDDDWLFTFTLFGRGMIAILQADYTDARDQAKLNLKLCEESGDAIGSTFPLIVLGHAAWACGEFEQARDFYLRCLKISQETGFHYALQTASKYLCKVYLSLGKLTKAETHLIQSLEITKEIGFIRDIVNLLYEYTRLQIARGNLERAVELLALVVQNPASQRHRMLEGKIRDDAESLLGKLEAELPQDVFKAALQRGQERDLDDVVSNLVNPIS